MTLCLSLFLLQNNMGRLRQTTEEIQNLLDKVEQGEISAASDWNAPKNEAGHINNRTHYIDYGTLREITINADAFDMWEEDDEYGDTTRYARSKEMLDYYGTYDIVVKTIDNSYVQPKYNDTIISLRETEKYVRQDDDVEWYIKLEYAYDDYLGEGYRLLLSTISHWDSVRFYLSDEYGVSVVPLQEYFIPEEFARQESIDELREETTALWENLDHGKFPNLVAGDLYGHGESVPAEFSFRATGGKSIKDGVAYIKELQGNAVVWNQSCKPFSEAIRFPHDSVILTEQGVSLTNWDAYQPFVLPANLLAKKGHKCLLMFSYTNTTPSPQFAVEVAETAETRFTFTQSSESVAIFLNVAQSSITDNINVFPYVNQTGECTISNIRFCDLTLMYGAGNEPTTIEEYYARKPIVADEYAYNEGEVIAFNGDAVKSVGDNAWDEQWELGRLNTDTGQPNPGNNGIQSKNYNKVLPNEAYYCGYNAAPIFAMFYDAEYNLIRQVSGSNNFINIRNRQFTTPANAVYMKFYVVDITTYNHDIMITLVHSGWKVDTNAGYQPYWADTLLIDERIKAEFPNGMHKWDKVYNKDGKGYIVKGTGSVDMGDCAWSYDSANQVFTTYTIMDLMAHPSVTEDRNKGLMCAKYAPSKGLVASTMDNKSWLRVPKNITIKDTDYTDAASFKAMLQEKQVILYYELEKPTIIPFDKPFNLEYKVADFGTEELIAAEQSAPFKARTIYQFNAVDQIRENYNEIEKIKAALAKAGITLDL